MRVLLLKARQRQMKQTRTCGNGNRCYGSISRRFPVRHQERSGSLWIKFPNVELLNNRMHDQHFFLQIDPQDNVLVALQELPAGMEVRFGDKRFRLISGVKAKHKFTIEPLAAGADIRMYGVLVGKTNVDLPQGETITTENIHN